MEKNIKSAEEVLKKWYNPLHISDITTICIVEAMKEYVRIKIEGQLEIATEEARTKSQKSKFDYYNETVVDEDSIRNCTRVTLE